jgi:hypothetical protein
MTQSKAAKKKSTFYLSKKLLDEIRELVPVKGLRSQNALVEEILINYITEFKRDALRQQYLEASRDPLFLAEIDKIDEDFKQADTETASMIQ